MLVPQKEPAEGGTEGTKSEVELGEFEHLIIEVAALYNEAKMTKVQLEATKDSDAKKVQDRHNNMQDEACKGSYDSLSIEERTVCLPLACRM